MSAILTGLVVMASALTALIKMVWRAVPTAPDGKTDLHAAGGVSDEKTSVFHDLLHLGGKNTKTMVVSTLKPRCRNWSSDTK